MNFLIILRYLVHNTFGLLSVSQFHSTIIMQGQEAGEHLAHKTKLLM
jgi:hypothetical protein